MQIIIHRGTHQIGGVAVEYRTASARLLIDMGDELSTDPAFVSAPLEIQGVTDGNGSCDAVLLTHYHGDHTGQIKRIRPDIPLYAGALAKDIMLMSAEHGFRRDDGLCRRIKTVRCFEAGVPFEVGDITVTPFSIDHSACDSYMFLLEADGKRVLHTGDFRTHGFRGKAIEKLLDRRIGRVDVLVTEGTTLSRGQDKPMTENELQRRLKQYISQYKYVFVLCASTNLERICAMSAAVPVGKYFICDSYQKLLLDLVERHWSGYSPLYRDLKVLTYGDNLLAGLRSRGFVMMVRDNRHFREVIRKFDPAQSIILYSMWDGYRTAPGSGIPEFLALAGRWEPLHTSGHASHDDIRMVAEKSGADRIIAIHTEKPDMLGSICPGKTVLLPDDGETIAV